MIDFLSLSLSFSPALSNHLRVCDTIASGFVGLLLLLL